MNFTHETIGFEPPKFPPSLANLEQFFAKIQTPQDLSIPLTKICDAMRASSLGKINIHHSFERDCELPLQSIVVVSQICMKILRNAVKYGCNSNGEGNIRVTCGKSLTGTIIIEISDSGSGLSEKIRISQNLDRGPDLIETLIRKAKGSIEYLSTSKGLTVRLEFPDALTATDGG